MNNQTIQPQSQHRIESYIDRYMPPWTRKTPGCFLEIGCWDGEMISQTYWLEKQLGWTGVCVDPFPRHFEKRSCQVMEKAISQHGLPRDFIKVSRDRRPGYGDVSYFSGFRDRISTHWDLIKEHCDYEVIEIPTITMEDLYKQCNIPAYVDFLSIDVEGAEMEILQSIHWDEWKYGMIVFEHNESADVIVRAGTLLGAAGYVRVESLRCDDIYLNVDLL